MRFWISDRLPEKVQPSVGEAVDTPEGGLINFLPDYWEYVAIHPALPGAYFIYYWIPMPGDEYLVATCWDDSFDLVVSGMTKGKFADVWTASVRRDWPLFALLNAAANVDSPGELRQGGLINLQAPNGSAKWFVAASFQGQLTQIEQMFSGASERAFHMVIRLSFDLGKEYMSGIGEGMVRLPPNLTMDLGAAEDPTVRRLKMISGAIDTFGSIAGNPVLNILEAGSRVQW
jgi:hypothetical protein